jgi:hypothetical protein
MAAEDMSLVRNELDRIAERHHGEAKPFSESERVLRLYGRAWTIIARDATRWLRDHPNASSGRLAAAIEASSPTAAAQCRRAAWAVDTSEDALGREGWSGAPPPFRDPYYDVCWAVDAVAVRLGTDAVTYAAYVTFGRQGRVMLLTSEGVLPQYATLPRGSSGAIRTLPDEAGGRHRFYVDARPADDLPLGASACRQLTILGWNGQTLEALLDRNYSTFKGTEIDWDGKTLQIRTKGAIRSFGTCGACTDFDAFWRVEVMPETIVSHDLVYDQPLVPLVDEFIVRVRDGVDVTPVGSPRAARDFTAFLTRHGCDGPCAFEFLGTAVERAARRATVSLAPYGKPRGTVVFAIAEHDGESYVDGVRFEPGPPRR